MPLQMEHLAYTSQEQQPSQWLVMATQILSLSSQELQTLIQQEATDNPALEVEEHPHCPTCGRALQSGRCLECWSRGTASTPADSQSLYDDAPWTTGASENGDN